MGVVRRDPCRIEWKKAVSGGIEVIVDIEAEKSGALDWELWLRKNVIMKIPGA
jgi:hypothetical protein